MQRQEEGPFRLKGFGGMGGWGEDLFFCVQTGGVVCAVSCARCHVCVRVRHLSLSFGNGHLQWGCVWPVSLSTYTRTHAHIDNSYSPAELHEIIIYSVNVCCDDDFF